MFLRPWRDSVRFLPLFPSDESPGYYLSPAGLGWFIETEFLLDFRFLHNIRGARNVFYKGAATGGGGRNDVGGRPTRDSPAPSDSESPRARAHAEKKGGI